jgi:nitrate reductase NapE
MASSSEATAVGTTRGQELRAFLFLTVVLAPVLAVMVVGGYGFLVWMYQLVAGPPGPPPL